MTESTDQLANSENGPAQPLVKVTFTADGPKVDMSKLQEVATDAGRLAGKTIADSAFDAYRDSCQGVVTERISSDPVFASAYSQCLKSLGDIKRLPFVGLNELNKLPTGKGIYVLVDSKDYVLYIGQTSKGLAFRWDNHGRLAQAISHDPESRLHYQVFPDATAPEHLLAVESAMISIFNPLWNGTPLSDGGSVFPGASIRATGYSEEVIATAKSVVSSFFRPSYAESLSPEQAIQAALEIGLRLSQDRNLPEPSREG
jgi:hypothetical protein